MSVKFEPVRLGDDLSFMKDKSYDDSGSVCKNFEFEMSKDESASRETKEKF
jgi:hypothetical protein